MCQMETIAEKHSVSPFTINTTPSAYHYDEIKTTSNKGLDIVFFSSNTPVTSIFYLSYQYISNKNILVTWCHCNEIKLWWLFQMKTLRWQGMHAPVPYSSIWAKNKQKYIIFCKLFHHPNPNPNPNWFHPITLHHHLKLPLMTSAIAQKLHHWLNSPVFCQIQFLHQQLPRVISHTRLYHLSITS